MEKCIVKLENISIPAIYFTKFHIVYFSIPVHNSSIFSYRILNDLPKGIYLHIDFISKLNSLDPFDILIFISLSFKNFECFIYEFRRYNKGISVIATHFLIDFKNI